MVSVIEALRKTVTRRRELVNAEDNNRNRNEGF